MGRIPPLGLLRGTTVACRKNWRMRGGALPAANRFAQLARARAPPGALRTARRCVLRMPDGPGWAAPRNLLTAARTARLERGRGGGVCTPCGRTGRSCGRRGA
eukprot:15277057-Alexandrium_andersonii.AAC.1